MRNSGWIPLLVLLSGCALYSEVSIGPLLMSPSDVRRSASSPTQLAIDLEFSRLLAMKSSIEVRERQSYKDFAALGEAELAANRLVDARRHLMQALDLRPPTLEAGQIAWALSQVAYLEDDYPDAAHWASAATARGTVVKAWHTAFLQSLMRVEVYRMYGSSDRRIPLMFGRPSIPRIAARVNGGDEATAVIDSGAVLSIVSETFAQTRKIRRLGEFKGTFFGLLGEPIPVTFGLIESLRLGDLFIENVPVAIMPDSKLRFFVANREPFSMELLLGTNLLKEFRLELDLRERWVKFSPLLPSQKSPAANQNLFFVGFQPFVEGAINRKGWHLFLLDTGSEITFLNDARLTGTSIWDSPKYHRATLQGLGGAQKSGSKVEDVEIGVDRWAGTFKTIPLYGSEEARSVGIIGDNFLRNFRVIIDFGSMRVDLLRERTMVPVRLP